MLKYSDLFEEVPAKYHDSAFLDRLHFYLPGWEIDIIRGEMFSNGYGFVVDYIAEILRSLRNDDFSNRYQDYFTLSKDISTRDRDAINKTFSGLMKILYPNNEATLTEIEEILKFAIEGRKRVKDQLMRIDSTYADTKFYYEDNNGKKYWVTTLEEEQYPHYYHKTISSSDDVATINDNVVTEQNIKRDNIVQEPQEQHLSFKENQKGITYDSLFGAYLKGATKITITDPYIRIFFQAKNLMELIETIINNKTVEDIVNLHLITIADDKAPENQLNFFEQIQLSAQIAGVIFTWEFDTTETIHARSIVTNTGWKISLDRGLDIFQPYAINDTFSLTNRLQQYRKCKAFEVTYIKEIETSSNI
jgi:ATP-dependent Lon protease